MVNKILDTSIIRDNPDIRYKPFLEYLEGDDIFSENTRNEMKSFLCNNILYNDELVKLNDKMIKFKTKPVLSTHDITFSDNDTDIFKKYGSIRSYFIKLRFSYDDLYYIGPQGIEKFNSFNTRIFTTEKSEYQIIPVVYKDFYYDIDIDHMMNDYSSFSVIIDYTKGIIYINDVLLNHLKMRRDKKYDIICNILVNKSKIVWDDDVYIDEIQTDNGKKLITRIREDSNEIEDLVFDYIPHNGLYSKIENPMEFVTEDKSYMITFNNVPYDTYCNFSSNVNGTIYHNDEFGFFSEDKNKTAMNVLAYDIAKYGLLKPIVINKFNGRFIVQSKTRFMIAQYLRLPEIPVVFYTVLGSKSQEISSINIFEKSQYPKTEITHEIKRILLPQIVEDVVDGVRVQ